MDIRESLPSDLKYIRELHLAAFASEENETVSNLAVELVTDCPSTLSLVAIETGSETENTVVGHVVFSPVSISDSKNTTAFILAPMAVLPSRQGQGIGRNLIKFGLDRLMRQNVDAVFVLGDPNYYQRSGFHTEHSVKPPYSLPYPEAWQAMELKNGALQNVSGTVNCVPALMAPELW